MWNLWRNYLIKQLYFSQISQAECDSVSEFLKFPEIE